MTARALLATDPDALGRFLRYGEAPGPLGTGVETLDLNPVREPDGVREPSPVREPDGVREPSPVREPDGVREPEAVAPG